MTYAEPRTREQRKEDTLAKLTAPAADAWVSTVGVDADGQVNSYLVPLSVAWIDERIVLATEADSVTARNVTNQRRVRLGLGPTRNVVMIDAELEQVYGLGEAPAELGRRYAAQADWDPRESGDGIRFLVCDPYGSRSGGRSTSSPGGP